MKECKVFVPFGALGGGIDPEAFELAMSMKPDIISTDAGSTDSGPYYLGTGKGKYARQVIRRDLEMIMVRKPITATLIDIAAPNISDIWGLTNS